MKNFYDFVMSMLNQYDFIKKNVELFQSKFNLDFYTAVVLIICGFLVYSTWRIFKNIISDVFYGVIKDNAEMFKGVCIYWINRVIKGRVASKIFLRPYCERLLKDKILRTLSVPGYKEIKIDIEEVFINLNLEGGYRQFTHWDIVNINSGNQLSNRLKIIGDPGSGKSTLVKKILLDTCSLTRFGIKALLPIIIELKKLEIPEKKSEDEYGQWFIKYLRDYINQYSIYKIDELFDIYIKDHGILVLLDGLDEVSTLQYHKVQQAINSLSTKLSHLSNNNVIILTMRSQYYHQVKNDFMDLGETLLVKPFSPTDIYDFLSMWPFQNAKAEKVSNIYKQLSDRPSLREMCSNPLILSMYVARNQDGYSADVPESRTEFYNDVVKELVVNRRASQIKVVARQAIRDQRERILGVISLKHLLNHEQPMNCLAYDEAITNIKILQICDDNEARVIFDDIVKETGLISMEKDNETFRFMHLTFCEFFAALEIVKGNNIEFIKLIDKHKQFQSSSETKSRLIEVIPFVSGLTQGRDAKEKIISLIFEFADFSLVGKCFFETKRYDYHYWAEYVDIEKKRFISVLEWDEQILKELHLFNTIVRDAEYCSKYLTINKDELNLTNLYQTIINIHSKKIGFILDSYAKQDAVAAFHLAELCNIDIATLYPRIVINNCDQKPFFEIAYKQAQKDRSTLWKILLAEAALHSRIVALWLSEKDQSFKNDNDFISSRKFWHFPLEEDNCYEQLLTIAINQDQLPAEAHLLKLLKDIPIPSSRIKLNYSCNRTLQRISLLLIIFPIYIFFMEKILNLSISVITSFVDYLVLEFLGALLGLFSSVQLSYYKLYKETIMNSPYLHSQSDVVWLTRCLQPISRRLMQKIGPDKTIINNLLEIRKGGFEKILKSN